MSRSTVLWLVLFVLLLGMIFLIHYTSDDVQGATPSLTITTVSASNETITIHYTTSDGDNDNLSTCGWQYSVDGDTWHNISSSAIGNNNTKPPGTSWITWNTTRGGNNLNGIEDTSVWFRMKVNDNKPYMSAQDSYNTPNRNDGGLAWDGKNIWSCEHQPGHKIYKHNMDETLSIANSYEPPANSHPAGLTWDGSNLWSADGDKIYKHNMDATLSVAESYNFPDIDPEGLTWDGSNLWSSDPLFDGSIYKHNMDSSLSVAKTYDTPGTSPWGLAWDGKNIWSSDWRDGKIYKHNMDSTLSIVETHSALLPHISGLTYDNSHLWSSGWDTHKAFIYKHSNSPPISSYSHSFSFTVDNKAPSSPISVTAVPDDWSPTNSFTISWTNPNSASSISKAYYKLDEAPHSDKDGHYVSRVGITQISDITVSDVGKHRLYLWLEDKWGNINYTTNQTTALYYDDMDPEPFTPTANPANWTKKAQPAITFSTGDMVSGIDRYEVKIDDGSFSIQDSPYTLPPQSDGTHIITVKAFDKAGNFRERSVNVFVDTIPPTLFTPSADPSDWTTNTQPTITFETVDITSGIHHYEVSIDYGDFTNQTSPFQLPPQEDGVHTIMVRAFDKAGNYIDGDVEVYISTEKPVVRFSSHSNGEWVGEKEVEVSWEGHSSLARITNYEVKIDDGDFGDVGLSTNYSCHFYRDGSHNLTVRVSDSAGNVEEYDLQINVDTSGPVMELIAPTEGNVLNEGDIEIIWKASDDGIGIKEFQIKLNVDEYYKVVKNDSAYTRKGLSDGKYTVYLKGIDNLGNDNITHVEFVIDTGEEIQDRDGDGYTDNSDVFPDDPAASLDGDGDGYPDKWNEGMKGSDSTTGLTLDAYPNDSNKWVKETNEDDDVPRDDDTGDDVIPRNNETTGGEKPVQEEEDGEQKDFFSSWKGVTLVLVIVLLLILVALDILLRLLPTKKMREKLTKVLKKEHEELER